MKLVVSLIFIALFTGFTYLISSKIFSKDKKNKKSNRKSLLISAIVMVTLLVLLASAIYRSETAADIWCGKTHEVTSSPPANLKSAMDYFEQGNYDYDTGDCSKAIISYTKSIKLDPTYPQAYNNRAYTNMRLRDYNAALPDLEKALSLKPNYIEALMNRADLHNYYYQIDRQSAIKDYEKAKSLGASQKETSVCGHLFLAKHNGWTPGAFLDLPNLLMDSCN
ncbi:MAG TPA: tetratricopeptide repeat protein [Methylomirabilota bacterium]|nr:tetratricopeptide repeat protein [Methylomirabilota bacterium]